MVRKTVKKADYGIHDALQKERNNYPFGEEGRTIQVSTDHNHYNLGCIGCGCPNQKTIEGIQASFGKLCRISSLRGDVWESSTPHRTCLLVHAYPQDQELESTRIGSQSCFDSTLILVDTFEDIKDRFRIASYIDFDILKSDPKELIYYINRVAKFGFDHIIIIGETEYEAQKYTVNGDELGWFVENGVVREHISVPQYVYPEALIKERIKKK
ncbi:unnamed protein product [Rhizophagus irregularis]|nr:unnamed protein product [Rhizophagus irregularis]